MTQKQKSKKVALDDIIIRYDLYPRLPHTEYDSSQNERAIETYKIAIEELPPITINQDNILIDGWHRWEAYKRIVEDIELSALDDEQSLSRGFDPSQIEVEVIKTKNELEVMVFAAKANAYGQVVMTREEKRRVAELLSDEYTDQEIADTLGTPRSTVNYWTKVHREAMTRVKQELAFKYADKEPEIKQTAIRAQILEEEGVEIPRSTHSDWLRDREEIEASWVEPEEVPVEEAKAESLGGQGDMTLGEYQSTQEAGKVGEAVPDSLAPSTVQDATIGYICDGYKPKTKGVSDKEYLQTGCLRCKNLRTSGLTGWEITNECTKGHQMVQTGLKRDR